MKRFQPACLAALAASLATCAIPAARAATGAAPDEVAMAAHHAVYKLTLLSAKGSSAPASAAGVIDYDFTGSSCDGYTTNFRQLIEVQPTEGDSKLNDMRSNTFEDGAAKQFTFKTKTSVDDDAASDLVGRAERASDGKINVDLKQPKGHVSFGSEVLFPTEHLRRIITSAERGDKILSADVYDGSETGQKLYHTLSVIGAPIQGTPDDAAGKAEATKGLRRWPVVISYFEAGKDQPDYVLSSDLYQNGVSRALKLDYGDFILAGALDQLTVPQQATCNK